jgi:thioredoxin 1
LPQIFDTPLFSSDQSIDRVLKAGLPVVLVFVTGTVPQALDQAMKTSAKRDAGHLLWVQLNPQESPETLRRFGLQQMPAVVAVKEGQAVSKAESITAEDLERHAAFVLGRGPKPEPRVEPRSNDPVSGASAARPAPTSAAGAQGVVPLAVSDANFEQEVMRSALPVVVDFWAPWCGPCRMTEPVLEKLSREMTGKLVIAKVNVDENPSVAQRYGIQSIPTMMVVKNGQIVDRWMGALPEANIRSRLSALRL